MNKTKALRYSAALAAACAGLLQSQAQTPIALPAAWALPDSAGDVASPGFNVRVNQANTHSGTLPNTLARAENQLAGLIIDPATGKPYTNDIDKVAFSFDSAGFYAESATIAYEQGGSAPNGFIPGIPGIEVQNDNIALEALTWLKLTPGTYTMVVNSDDGFRLSAGRDARDKLDSVVLGEYDGGRAASDTSFKFSVSQEGLYSFRLLYFEGNGGANVSWFTALPADLATRVLVNDTAAGGLQAFRKVTTESRPYVSLVQPGKGQTRVSPSAPLKVVIADGAPGKVNASTVKLSLDGALVPAVVTNVGGATTATYITPALLEPLSTHTLQLVFADNASPANVRTSVWTYTVSPYTNIKLPAPLVFEDFESTDEGKIPAGWTRQNFTSGATGAEDLNDPNSDSYLDWTVISRDRVTAIGALNRWDAAIRLESGENYVNGKRVEQLVVGKFAYAESDNRGGSQIQYLFSKDYVLTGKTNIYVAYHSIYEQNQDSVGAVEYSIDGGATWLPILYMLDEPDIVRDAGGKINAVATMNAMQPDAAVYTDPVTGANKGGTYGSFIGAAITADLAPFIQGRVNDDPVESKRVEFHRLPKADNQASVRFRFAQAGTASWYFGIDNLGLYSIAVIDPPKITTGPANANGFVGLSFSLKVDASGVGLTYQWYHDKTLIPGATGATYSVGKAVAADAGKYLVKVTNGGGFKDSAEATVTVGSAPTTIPVSDALALYLKFDNNLTDSSTNKADGTPVGSPTFDTGLFGKGLHVKTKKDGSENNYVTLGYPASLKFGDENGSDFTVSFWVKVLAQADDQPFLSNKDWNSSNNQGWGIFSQDGKNYRVNATGPDKSTKFSKSPGGVVGDGNWHNLIVSVARTGFVNSYVDGNLNDSTAISTKGSIDTHALATPLSFNIGQDGTGSYTDGAKSEIEFVMDDLAIWRRAFPADQVAALYLAGASGKSLAQLAVAVPAPVLAFTRGNGTITLTWVGSGFTLKGSSTLVGTYNAVAGAGANSATVPTLGTQQFFHLEK